MNYKDIEDGDIFSAIVNEYVCTVDHVFNKDMEVIQVPKRRMCVAVYFEERFGMSSGMGFEVLGYNMLMPLYRATELETLENVTWEQVHKQSKELQQTAEYMRMKEEKEK